ncbi:MAG: hypothetical protein FJ288_11295 [Planctomycetes bacterium]|nr:hypothetical protein [Planctomycetota bacterium]
MRETRPLSGTEFARRVIHFARGLAALGVLGTAIAQAAWAAEAPPARIAIAVALEQPGAAARAGEPLALRITLRNATDKPLAVPDWDHFAEALSVRVHVAGCPGENGNAEGPAPAAWEGVPFQRRDFRGLAPGETAVSRSIVPLVPGKARLTVGLHGPSDTYRALTDGKPVRLQNAWTGDIYASMNVEVSAEMSPEMQRRYGEVRERLADLLVPAEQKGRLLATVADEGHYHAATFLRDVRPALPAGPMQDAALWQLLRLAKAGAGYEAVPLVLDAMTDAGAEQTIRVAILEWAAESLAQGGRLPIGDQALYVWPDEVLNRARGQLQHAAGDRNPFLAARAKELLRGLDAAQKP